MISAKPIIPPEIRVRSIENAIIKMKWDKGRQLVKWLEGTVRTWEHKPSFKADLDFRGNDVIITVEIRGSYFDIQLWNWLNEGVPGHQISSSSGDGLGFPNRDPNVGGRMYVPETKPGKLVSVAGAPEIDDGPFHGPDDVAHPGIEARDWSGTIRDMMKKTFGKRAKVEFRRIIEDEGW